MSSRIVVDGFEISYDSAWTLRRWDEGPEYANGIRKLQGTQAVDLIGLRVDQSGSKSIYLIEVTDFTDYPTAAKAQFRETLSGETALKVRDTLVGILGAARKHAELRQYVEAVTNSKWNVVVVLWALVPLNLNAAEVDANTVKGEIERHLKWLDA